MRVTSSILAGLFLTACSVGPDYRPPSTDLPDRYSLLAPVTKAGTSDLEWWRDFNDPVLDRLVARAMVDNISIAEARERVAEAQAEARRAGVPLSGDATATIRDNSRGSDTASAGLSAEYNLAGRAGWAGRAASQRLNAAEIGVEEARRLLLAELGSAYIELRFLQESLTYRNQDMASRRRTLRDLNTKLEVGEGTRLDTLRAEALILETQADIPQVGARIVQQRNRISTLLGVPVGSLGIDLSHTGSQPRPIGATQPGVPADLLRARPDIRIAERRYAAAVSDLGVAEASRYPSLSLSGAITAPLSGGSSTESLAAGLVLPVFDQPGLAAAADSAESRARQAYLQWLRTVLEAVEQVENELAALRAARQAVAASRQLVALNQEALSVSRELLTQGGNATVLDVIDRERSLSAARATLAADLRDLALAHINLRTALGIGHSDPIVINTNAARPTSNDAG